MRPDSLPGLQIGGSFDHDKISDTVRSQGVRYGQTIVNGKSFAEKRAALHSLCRRLDCRAKPFSYFRARSLSSRPKM